MKKLWNSFKIAFAMYSKIPMPQSEWTEENMAYAMCFFPWVGAVTGGMSYLVVLFADLLKEREISFGSLFFPAVLTVLPVLISGGIHMDGFLDTQDALSSWQSKEKRLEILKDPHAGAFAILSGCVYFILSLGIYSGVTEESMRLIGMGFILSRTLSGISVLRFPQARKNGLVAVFAEHLSGAGNCSIVMGRKRSRALLRDCCRTSFFVLSSYGMCKIWRSYRRSGRVFSADL